LRELWQPNGGPAQRDQYHEGMQIGLLSDTHGFLDEAIFTYFEKCDEIWHAGDFGAVEILDRLKPSNLRAVSSGTSMARRSAVSCRRTWIGNAKACECT
jgi:Calcineurin-like phosphoesterase superfamily domain